MCRKGAGEIIIEFKKNIIIQSLASLEQKSKRKHHHDLSSHLVVLSHDQEDEDEDAALSFRRLFASSSSSSQTSFALFFERDFIRERERVVQRKGNPRQKASSTENARRYFFCINVKP